MRTVMRSSRATMAAVAALVFALQTGAEAQVPPEDPGAPVPGDDGGPPREPDAPGHTPDADVETRRTALFFEGHKAASEGRWAEAAAKWREVVALRSAPRALIALARAESMQNHLLAAKALLIQARNDAQMSLLAEDRAAAELDLAVLLPAIPRVRIVIDGPRPRELTVWAGGQKVPLVDDHAELDPGRHQLSVRALGHRPHRAQVDVARGETTMVRARLVPWDATAEGERAPSPAKDYAAPGVLGAAGLVVVGVGFTLMGVGRLSQDEAVELCGGRRVGCPETARYPALRGRDEILAGDALVGIGGAAVAASVAWMIALAATGEPVPPDRAADGLRLSF